MQLHTGTFPSFHTLTWQCWNRWARDSPADGGDATLTDANRHKSHQKKKKKAGRVYAGEDVLLFSGTWQWGAVFVCCWCSSYVLWTSFQLFLKKSSLFANKRTWIVVSYHISYESIRRVTVSKSHIQLRHQRSPVIGSLAPRESVLRARPCNVTAFTHNKANQRFPWNVTGSWCGKLAVLAVFLNTDPCSHSHMTPCKKCSWTFQGQNACVKGASVYFDIQVTILTQTTIFPQPSGFCA